ncbi:MAG TPA: hypothetical protein VFM18_24315 [Methanosarcina sp.]|nr:hypothetical protein [Methanosarcina sp.]
MTTGTPLDQLVTSNEALSTYYQGLANYLQTHSGPVDFSTVVNSLDYSELLRRAQQDAGGPASTATAVAVEEVHSNVAHLREYAMSSKSKSDLYLSMQSEFSDSAQYHKDRSVLLASQLTGDETVPYLP